MYESLQISDNQKNAKEFKKLKNDEETESLKQLVGLWMKQLDLSISQLKQGIKIFPTQAFETVKNQDD